MKASIVTRLDRLYRRLPPTWADLCRLALPAGETMNQAEVDAYLAHIRRHGTAEQEALWDEWLERNLPRIWAVWDERYPGWRDAPFWPADEDSDDWADESAQVHHEDSSTP